MIEIVVRKFHIDGIPISIYEQMDGNLKPVIFSFHGFDGYKDGDFFKREDELARRGFMVIGIDTILHGERKIPIFDSKPYEEKMKDIHHCVIQTAMDAIQIYEKYIRFMPRVINGEVYAIGVSMGGAISIYMATIYPLKKAVSIVGSPSMIEFYQIKQEKYQWQKDFYYERNLAYLNAFDPLLHTHQLTCPLFLTAGVTDDVIPLTLVSKLKHPKITFKAYDTGHMPNQAQFNDAYTFLLSKEDV
jgi:uncharacterized protein